jgi:hypothetical protein
MLDRAWRATFRNFSTLFLVVAVVTIPLHLTLSYLFRDAIAVGELHPQIAELPRRLQVHGVSAKVLDRFHLWTLGVVALEVVLIPLFARASARVVEVDAAGRLPSATDAWMHAARTAGGAAHALAHLVNLAMGVAVAVATGWLWRAIGLTLAAPLPDEIVWAAVGAVEGAAWGVGLPFLLVCINLSSRGD